MFSKRVKNYRRTSLVNLANSAKMRLVVVPAVLAEVDRHGKNMASDELIDVNEFFETYRTR